MNAMGAPRFSRLLGRLVSTPAGQPVRHRAAAEEPLPTEGLRSKSWDEFAGPARPNSTSSSRSAIRRPARPAPLAGQPITAHWVSRIRPPSTVTTKPGARLLPGLQPPAAPHPAVPQPAAGQARPRGTDAAAEGDRRLVNSGGDRRRAAAAMSIFERYLTVWVALCIVAAFALARPSRRRCRRWAAWRSRRSICRSAC